MTSRLDRLAADLPGPVLITGGAGFVGSHLTDVLTGAGIPVTVLDDGSNYNREWVDRRRTGKNIDFREASILDPAAVSDAMAGCAIVFHFAANAHIDRGLKDTGLDFRLSVDGTRNVLEAMREHGVGEIVFPSSGAVYGNLGDGNCSESAGPLLPLSPYGAGKVAAEALLASYASLFGIRAWVFRFGNVLGARMSRGAIHDFLERLTENPAKLLVLGDGRQTKSYLIVEDCIEGMLWLRANAAADTTHPLTLFNLGNSGGTSVADIADTVLKETGNAGLGIELSGGRTAFPGDQPVVRLDVSKAERAGWTPRHPSDEAVRIAVRRLAPEFGLGGGS